MLKQWNQQWPFASLSAAGSGLEKNGSLQKRLVEAMTETLNRQRELIESACRTSIQFLEHAARITDAKSPDDYRRLMEELWAKLFEGMKQQSEAQVQELKKTSETLLEVAQGSVKAGA